MSPFWLIVWCSVIVELGILGIVLWVTAIRSLAVSRPALSLYELRRREPRSGRRPGRSTGTRPSRRFAWRLTVEGVVWAAVVYRFLTWGVGRKW